MGTSLLHTLEFFLLPLGISLLLLLISLVISRRRPRLSFGISLTSLLLLAFFSSPMVARKLLMNIQEYTPIQISEHTDTDGSAIVILGGGRYSAAPEYGKRDTISTLTLERLRYGANLAQESKLPIVLSGGRRNSNATSEAVIMNQIMVTVFNINPHYLEVNGANTHQQAIEVRKLLAKQSINKIYLVTHAWHMKRAVAEFSLQGFDVIPAPMGFAATSIPENRYLPSAAALASSSKALHERYALLYLKIIR